MNRRQQQSRFSLAVMLLLSLSGCALLYASIDEHTPPPVGWPKMVPEVHKVSQPKMREECAPYVGSDVVGGCAIIDLMAKTCVIWLDNDFPVDGAEIHERKHCAGYDHPGGKTISRMMNEYKTAEAK